MKRVSVRFFATLSLLFATAFNLALAADSGISAKVASPSMSAGQPSQPAIQLPMPRRAWTVMVFSNGKNNLAVAHFLDFEEMEAAGSSQDVNIVAEMGLVKDEWLKDNDMSQWIGVRRFYVTKDPTSTIEPERISGDVAVSGSGLYATDIVSIPLPGPARADMGSYRHLANFVRYAKANFPADRYMLILSNHGAGIYGISFDDKTGHHIDMPQLRKALAAGGGVDILATNACMMQMAEVAAELKNSAEILVGSQAIGRGYDFYPILSSLSASPAMSTEDAATVIVNAFKDRMAGSGHDTDISALRTSAFDGFAERLNTWIDAVHRAPDGRKALLVAVRRAKHFKWPGYRDLAHFARLTAANSQDAALSAATDDLLSYMDKGLLVSRKQHISKQANGLSIYIPDDGVIDARYYKSDAMAGATRWYDFLQWMIDQKILKPKAEQKKEE